MPPDPIHILATRPHSLFLPSNPTVFFLPFNPIHNFVFATEPHSHFFAIKPHSLFFFPSNPIDIFFPIEPHSSFCHPTPIHSVCHPTLLTFFWPFKAFPPPDSHRDPLDTVGTVMAQQPPTPHFHSRNLKASRGDPHRISRTERNPLAPLSPTPPPRLLSQHRIESVGR